MHKLREDPGPIYDTACKTIIVIGPIIIIMRGFMFVRAPGRPGRRGRAAYFDYIDGKFQVLAKTRGRDQAPRGQARPAPFSLKRFC